MNRRSQTLSAATCALIASLAVGGVAEAKTLRGTVVHRSPKAHKFVGQAPPATAAPRPDQATLGAAHPPTGELASGDRDGGPDSSQRGDQASATESTSVSSDAPASDGGYWPLVIAMSGQIGWSSFSMCGTAYLLSGVGGAGPDGP
ncbi:MAG: hypothetical protein QOI62_1008 [Solirubrobacteraceae bacterium]|nr:hypothetical protein [Solirubrobacteraceae bacterium]